MKTNILSRKSLSFYIVLLTIAIVTNSSNCGGDDVKINYENGFFPDSTINMAGVNSSYDDYNIALPQLFLDLPLMFSSNRNSSGQNFDFVTGFLHYAFNQIDGSFIIDSEMYDSPFYEFMEDLVNTDGDEFGPMRMFNGNDGYEYFFYSSDSQSDNHDLKFVQYLPSGGVSPPFENYEGEVSVLNSASDDAYISIDWEIETAYFTSDRAGDFDIYELSIPSEISLPMWLEGSAGAAVATDSINSAFNDKCPFIMDTIMVFTSDKPGGLGGFDLYYSMKKDGKWGSPKNFGPNINTEYNEYRPLIGYGNRFTNNFLLFSSDRPGGKGGYDLYFAGVDL